MCSSDLEGYEVGEFEVIVPGREYLASCYSGIETYPGLTITPAHDWRYRLVKKAAPASYPTNRWLIEVESKTKPVFVNVNGYKNVDYSSPRENFPVISVTPKP